MNHEQLGKSLHKHEKQQTRQSAQDKRRAKGRHERSKRIEETWDGAVERNRRVFDRASRIVRAAQGVEDKAAVIKLPKEADSDLTPAAHVQIWYGKNNIKARINFLMASPDTIDELRSGEKPADELSDDTVLHFEQTYGIVGAYSIDEDASTTGDQLQWQASAISYSAYGHGKIRPVKALGTALKMRGISDRLNDLEDTMTMIESATSDFELNPGWPEALDRYDNWPAALEAETA